MSAPLLRRLAVPADVSGRRLLASRDGLVVAVLFYLLVSGILSALWRAAAGEHGDVAGYSAAALTWYVFTAEAATCAINVRLIEEVGDDIGSGSVAVEMLRPLPVVAVRLAAEVGRCTARLAVLLVPGATYAWIVVGPPPSTAGVVLAVPALVLAVAVNLCLQHALAGAAFWLRDTRATWFLYQKLVFILGGMLLPLEVLPGVLREVAMVLPFMAMAYAPARLASGHVEPWLLLVQAAWLVVLAAGAAAVFAAGQRRLQVVGG
ncbi:MAG TPA: ABC-2 family transporter protein [Actinomycetes bacterium]|nr:ABC-2 family transporter protein [Actinomycetes bacterium]